MRSAESDELQGVLKAPPPPLEPPPNPVKSEVEVEAEEAESDPGVFPDSPDNGPVGQNRPQVLATCFSAEQQP